MPTPLSILIADDEPAARRHVLRQLARSSVPHRVVGEAANGHQLVEAAQAHPVDVILLDIMMPGCNGLEALQQLSTLDPQPEVIIISAYDRFEFAQDALRLGVRDFLLKPVRSGQLDQSLQQAAGRLERRRRQVDQSQLWERHGRHHQDNVYRQLLLGDVTAMDASLPRPHPEPLALWLMAFDLPVPARQELGQSAAQWAGESGGRLLFIRPGRGVILLDALEGAPPAWVRAHQLLSRLNGESRIAYSGPVRAPEELAPHYRRLCSALALAYVSGENLLDGGALAQQPSAPALADAFALRGQLATQVRSGSPAQALDLLAQLLEHAAAQPASGGVEFLTLELISALTVACQVASEHHPDPPQLQELQTRALSRLLAGGSAQELAGIARTCLEQVFSGLVPAGSGRQQLVSRARAYIREHASEPLTLGQVAQAVYVSPYYLSHLFRELEDTTFQDCLITERMKKAQQLLGRTQLSSQEVARAVGYQSASHFSQLFKRITGASPSAFRRQHQRRSNTRPDEGTSSS